MIKSQMKSSYQLLKKPEQSFAEYCKQEMDSCSEQLRYAIRNAPKTPDESKPVFYTIFRHASRSGMSRTISVHYFDTAKGRMCHLNYVASVITGRPMDRKRDGVICKGCGMDMGFDLVYALASAATGDGYAIDHQWL